MNRGDAGTKTINLIEYLLYCEHRVLLQWSSPLVTIIIVVSNPARALAPHTYYTYSHIMNYYYPLLFVYTIYICGIFVVVVIIIINHRLNYIDPRRSLYVDPAMDIDRVRATTTHRGVVGSRRGGRVCGETDVMAGRDPTDTSETDCRPKDGGEREGG